MPGMLREQLPKTPSPHPTPFPLPPLGLPFAGMPRTHYIAGLGSTSSWKMEDWGEGCPSSRVPPFPLARPPHRGMPPKASRVCRSSSKPAEKGWALSRSRQGSHGHFTPCWPLRPISRGQRGPQSDWPLAKCKALLFTWGISESKGLWNRTTKSPWASHTLRHPEAHPESSPPEPVPRDSIH